MNNKKHIVKSKLIAFKDSTVMVLEKNRKKKRYVLAGGFLKKGESPEEGLIREVYEETGVILSKTNFRYYATNTMMDCDKNTLSRHYFILVRNGQEFKNNEPKNFKSLKWVKWTKTLKFINPSDRNTIERLFKGSINPL